MASTQPTTQKTTFDAFGKILEKISCKTFHRKIYLAYFCHFVYNPLSKIVLHTLYRSLGEDNMNLLNLRTMLLYALSFLRFLIFPEFISLKCSDLILKETHMSIFIEKSKTKVYREGYWMHLSNLQSVLCPIKLLRKYIEAAKTKESEEKFIFRQIYHSKQGFKLKDLDKPISYTTVKDILLTSLKKIGLDKT